MPKGKYTIGYVSFLNKCFVDKVNDLKGLIAKKRVISLLNFLFS